MKKGQATFITVKVACPVILGKCRYYWISPEYFCPLIDGNHRIAFILIAD